MSINNKKVIAIIVARLSSSRLPEKHFKLLLNKPLISWTLNELRKSKYIDRIVIATTDRAEDDKLYAFAIREKIDCYRYSGNIDHVTKRIRKTAEQYHADVVVSISGDCPLIYAPTIDRMVEKLSEEKADTCNIAERNGRKCIHEGIGVMTMNTWRKIDDLSMEPVSQEHPGSYAKDRPDEFLSCAAEDEEIFYEINHRISVDTPADMEFMNKVFSVLNGENKDISLPNVIDLLKKRPDLMEINKHVYQKKLRDKTGKILFRVNGGKGIGLGHLMREITIAKLLMEFHGAGVRFLVNGDVSVKDILTRYGLPFFTLSAGGQREEEISMIKSIFEEFKFHMIILDLRGVMSINYMNSLKSLNVPAVSVDNTSKGACLADINIFPVAYFDDKFLSHCDIKGEVYGGAEYVVIDDKFNIPHHGKRKHSQNNALKVLVTFGGTDPNNLTERVVRALVETDLSLQLDVIIGPAFRKGNRFEDLFQKYKEKITLYKNIDNLSGLMSTADIAFTALGITTYELAYMGVPSVIIANFRSDEKYLNVFKKLGISLPLGYYNDLTGGDIRRAAGMFVRNKSMLKSMSQKGKRLIDGYGAKRIADIIMEKIIRGENNKQLIGDNA